jgi:hypothetical protein
MLRSCTYNILKHLHDCSVHQAMLPKDGLTPYEREVLRAELRRQREAERRRQRRVMELRQRAQREREADMARGPCPPASRQFRVPADAVPELLMTWELCQSFGAALQVRRCRATPLIHHSGSLHSTLLSGIFWMEI